MSKKVVKKQNETVLKPGMVQVISPTETVEKRLNTISVLATAINSLAIALGEPLVRIENCNFTCDSNYSTALVAGNNK
jgi:hypothetical protein